MSRLWPKVRIAIAPTYVAVAGHGSVRESAVKEASSEAVLKTLADLLAELHLRGRAEVVLSHQLAPIWLLPAPPVRLNWQETGGWVRERLTAQFGEMAAKWHLIWQLAPPGEPILASGVDAAWLQNFTSILQAKGIKPQRAEPWLAATCNRHRRALSAGATWLALAEPGRITLAGMARGRLQTLCSSQITEEPAATLAGMLARETLLGTVPAARRIWLQAVHAEADWRNIAGMEVRELSPASAGFGALIGA